MIRKTRSNLINSSFSIHFFIISSVIVVFCFTLAYIWPLRQQVAELDSSLAAGSFIETFDGKPAAPEPFTQVGQNTWDVAIHSRNTDTWEKLVPFKLQHGPGCEPPLLVNATAPYGSGELMTHDWDGTYEGAVFKCADHVMTGIFGVGRSINDGYGLIALTPNQMVDFTNGPATIKWNMTTYRTTQRDWIDVWITPYDENLQLPFDSSNLGKVDLQGSPRNAVEFTMFAPNDNAKSGIKPVVIKNGSNTGEFREFSSDYNSFLGYEDYLPGKAGDPKRRDTFEITISQNHLKVCMPADPTDNAPSQTICWADKNIGALPFTKGIVQFAHHSYTPNKDCSFYTPLICGPNTWHWDDIQISPAIPFKMIKANVRAVTSETTPVVFNESAPADAKLRFSAAGSVQLSFNGSAYQSVSKQPSTENYADHVASYFVPVPQGTNSVRFKLTENGTGSVIAQDFAIWSLNGVSATNQPTATPGQTGCGQSAAPFSITQPSGFTFTTDCLKTGQTIYNQENRFSFFSIPTALNNIFSVKTGNVAEKDNQNLNWSIQLQRASTVYVLYRKIPGQVYHPAWMGSDYQEITNDDYSNLQQFVLRKNEQGLLGLYGIYKSTAPRTGTVNFGPASTASTTAYSMYVVGVQPQ